MNRIGVWGDSIAWGASDHELGGWVARLRLYIDNEHGGWPEIYNLGVDGDKVGDVLNRFDAEHQARKIDVAILAVGINDSPHDSHPKGTTLESFEKKFNELASGCLLVSKKLIVLGPTNVDDKHPARRGYSDRTIKPYANIIQKVATKNKLTYVDLWGVFTKDDLKLDGLHPEASGHEKIFQKVKVALGY